MFRKALRKSPTLAKSARMGHSSSKAKASFEDKVQTAKAKRPNFKGEVR